ncbi:hypothetical protein MAPG_04295 [Magnaporthiopsis poae ATCC 64411]|uniref:Rhodopsin domain-containing protein n=1 Tax=Magnaporthiopsis poae (strain ATCC 64411 / 73-15) TaxID=644358 RepID=A0A0C4DWB9_MAGP6|nr:hypothetical protein MAPG_04295 [Magnaporthiopsis poae ATCC 64411]
MAAIVNGVPVVMPPPPGYVVDFANPQRNSVEAAYTIGSIGMTLALFFVFQRFYVKLVIRKKVGLDDGLLIGAWLGSIAIQALVLRSFAKGYMGVHGWEIPLDLFQQFAYTGGYVNSVVYPIPTVLSKTVILLFLLEINAVQKWYRWSIYTTMFVVVAAGIGIFFASVFPCWPIAKSYDLAFPPNVGSCINRPAMYQATAALGVITDVMIIGIPVPMVLSLHISRNKKIGLLILFAIGSATVITSIVRLYLLITILDDVDQTWGGGPVSVWILVEANLLIMCACLSTLRHFFRAVAPGFLSSSRGSKGKKASGRLSGTEGSELQTIGQISSKGRGKKHFLKLIDGRADLESQAYAGRSSDETKRSDEASDRGIVQTKTTKVTSEPRR